MKRHIALILVAIGAVACNGQSVPSSATPSPIATGAPSFSTQPGPTDAPQPTGPSAQIELDISGGPHDGSYRAVTATGCDTGPAQNGFSVSYANELAPGGFVALDLVLRDVAMAEQDETGDFHLEVSVGGAGGVSYTLDPEHGEGTGTALLDVSPDDAVLDLIGQADDGTGIEVLITCGSV